MFAIFQLLIPVTTVPAACFVFMFVFLLLPSFSVFCLLVHSDILSTGRLKRSANLSGFYLSFTVHAEYAVDDNQSEIDPPPPASQFERPSSSPSPGVFRTYRRNTAWPLSYPPTHSQAHQAPCPSPSPVSVSSRH